MLEKWLILVLAFIVFLFTLGFPEYYLIKTPYAAGYYKVEAVVLVLLCAFLCFYLTRKRQNYQLFTTVEIYALLLLAMPLYSGFLAWCTFGQPVYLGVLADRRWGMVVLAILLLLLLEAKYLDFEALNRTFLVAGILIICLGIFTEWNLGSPPKLNPSRLFHWRFLYTKRFSNVAVAFVVMACLAALRLKKQWVLVPALMGLVAYPAFTLKGRGFILGLVITTFIIMVLHRKRAIMVRNAILAIILIAVLLSVFYVLKPKRFEFLVRDMGYVVKALSGEETGDVDTDIRIQNFKNMVSFIVESPFQRVLLGSGRLSYRFQEKSNQSKTEKRGGFPALFDWFWPQDNGFVGMIFQYGLLGFFFVQLAFWFAWKFSLAEEHKEHIVFWTTLKYFILYVFIQSFENGLVFKQPEVVMVPLFILWYMSDQYQDFQERGVESQGRFTQMVNRVFGKRRREG